MRGGLWHAVRDRDVGTAADVVRVVVAAIQSGRAVGGLQFTVRDAGQTSLFLVVLADAVGGVPVFELDVGVLDVAIAALFHPDATCVHLAGVVVGTGDVVVDVDDGVADVRPVGSDPEAVEIVVPRVALLDVDLAATAAAVRRSGPAGAAP